MRRFCCGLLACVLSAPVGWSQTVWDFESGAQGWVVADLQTYGPYHPPLATYSVTHIASGGCEGGYIQRFDPSSNSYSFRMPLEQVPAGTLAPGSRLQYCMRTTHQSWTGEPWVVLAGGGQVLRADLPIADLFWSGRTLDFVPEAFLQINGQPVSQAMLGQVMESLDALYIMAETGSTIVETTSLDEVLLLPPCGELEAPVVTATALGQPDVDGILLVWNPVPGARSYQVLEYPEAWGPAQPLGTTEGLTWTVPVTQATGIYGVRALCD